MLKNFRLFVLCFILQSIIFAHGQTRPFLNGNATPLVIGETFTINSKILSDWEQHPNKDRYKEEVFKDFFREALESGGALLAIDCADRQVIGSSRFYGYDEEKSEIEIGWTFLARSHWGGNYNREMKQLMLRHAFKFVNNVVFLVGPQNLRSQKAVEKIGGVRIDSMFDDTGKESFVYQINASVFEGEN